MNVYQKLAEARQRLKNAGLKQSGKNNGVGYTYFDLHDILPQTTAIERELGLLSAVSFDGGAATLTVYNTEKPEENIVFTSPVADVNLRSCHPVQNLGATETYVRRYLYLLAYEIVETDSLDKEYTPRKAKAQTLQELIAGTDIQPQQITEFIEENFGSAIRVNNLTDEQFEKLYKAIKKYKTGE